MTENRITNIKDASLLFPELFRVWQIIMLALSEFEETEVGFRGLYLGERNHAQVWLTVDGQLISRRLVRGIERTALEYIDMVIEYYFETERKLAQAICLAADTQLLKKHNDHLKKSGDIYRVLAELSCFRTILL